MADLDAWSAECRANRHSACRGTVTAPAETVAGTADGQIKCQCPCHKRLRR